MAWQGFMKESKSFMNYNARTGFGKLRFWAYYPIALIKYKYCIWRSLRSDRFDWKFLFKHRSKMCDNNRG